MPSKASLFPFCPVIVTQTLALPSSEFPRSGLFLGADANPSLSSPSILGSPEERQKTSYGLPNRLLFSSFLVIDRALT